MKNKKAIIATVLCLAFVTALSIYIVLGINSYKLPSDYESDSNSNPTIQEQTTVHLEEIPDGYVGIYSVEDFDYLRNSSTGSYILMNDIDMTNVESWEGINFQGSFNGNNYEIKNYHFSNGFFNYLTDATVKNLTLSVNISETNKNRTMGVFANKIETSNSDNSSSYISFIRIKGNINVTSSPFGTIAGAVFPGDEDAWVYIDHVTNEANITGDSSTIGGIIGTVSQQNASETDPTALQVSNAVNKGNITISHSRNDHYVHNVGGIIGDGLGYIQCCDNYGNISLDCPTPKYGDPISYDNPTYVRLNSICGGIIGSNGYCHYKLAEIYPRGEIGDIFSCSNYGKIISKNSEYTGGIIGYAAVSYSLRGCGNFADISGMNAGGIQGGGYYLSQISDCINTGSITGSETSGALIGVFFSNAPEPINCYYLNNGVNSVGVKAAFPTVYSVEANQLTDESVINLDENLWTFEEAGPTLYSTIGNKNIN